MKRNALFTAFSAVALTFALGACEGDDGRDGAVGPAGAPGADGANGTDGAPGADGTNANAAISLKFLGRTPAIAANFDKSAAEIVAYDATTQQAYLVNANAGLIDIVDLAAPTMPTIVDQLDASADVTANVAGNPAMGGVNSVAVYGDTVAVAVEADVKQDNGYIAFYGTDGTFLSAVEVGALPDMVGFTPDGNYVLSANEGEPNGDYSNDPEGSVSIIDVSGGFTELTAVTASFAPFNAGGLTGPVRVSAKAESVAKDMEPEYIAFSADSTKAYVALQENNAIAVVDIAAGVIDDVIGMGFKDYGLPGNELDASNEDGPDDGAAINIRNWSVFGTYMPDTIATYEVNGTTYLVTANEGDGREYRTEAVDGADCDEQGGYLFAEDEDNDKCFHYLDEIRIKDLGDAQFTNDLKDKLGADFQDKPNLGRLKVITNLGLEDSAACATVTSTGQPVTFDADGDTIPVAECVYENLYSFGARSFTIWNTDSFTIWNTETARPVFDSGSDFEVITAQQLGLSFNASNDDNEGDDRSDDKGPEPEAVTIAEIAGNTYAFIGLERVGGVMVYNITNPQSAQFVQYINPRDFTVDAKADVEDVGDLGPESIVFIAAEDSPSGEPLLLVSNEVSGTLAVYSVTAL